MKIVLITPTPPDINAFGVRTLSSLLLDRGYDVKVIFLPGGIEFLNFKGDYIYQYGEKTLRQIAEICEDASMIGFSFMSQYLDRTVQITRYLKKHFDTPIIWGGTHPTYRPEQCLDYCDIVCVGEGEYSIVALLDNLSKGQDYEHTGNCWMRTNHGLIQNEPHPIVQDLDKLPFVDYNIQNHYVYSCITEEIIPMDESVMKEHFLKMLHLNNKSLITYRTMTSRGCPHRCSYCASSAMGNLRRRSVDNVIEELKWILGKFGYIKMISFFDDTFFAAPIGYFEEFRDKYKANIDLPFHAQCSPTTIDNKKMDLLVDAGLFHAEMGIQTGSERIKKLYRRKVSNQTIIDIAELINKYRLIAEYHIILDNPWEEKEDVLDTLRLLLKLPGKYSIDISSLIFYPGTELNVKAKNEGFLTDELNEVCRKPFTRPKATYLNYLIYMAGFPAIPRWLLKLLSNDRLVSLLYSKNQQKKYQFLFFVTDKIRLIGKGIFALMRGDLSRITNYFRLIR